MVDSKEKVALEAIFSSRGTELGEYGVDLFITHHLDELSDEDWISAVGYAKPTPLEILNSLVLKSCWSDGRVYDFTLPNSATDYVMSVSFDENGVLDDISMES